MPCIDNFRDCEKTTDNHMIIMLLQALKYLTKEQIDEISNEYGKLDSEELSLTKLLCKISKFLTPEQIQSVIQNQSYSTNAHN